MVAIQLGVSLDLRWIVLMMRTPVKTHAHPAFGEQWIVLREWIRFAGEIPRAEQRHHTGDVGLQRKRSKIPVQLDVIVELIRNTGWFPDFRNRTGRLGSQLKPALDLANFLRVLIDCSLIRCPETLLQAL